MISSLTLDGLIADANKVVTVAL